MRFPLHLPPNPPPQRHPSITRALDLSPSAPLLKMCTWSFQAQQTLRKGAHSGYSNGEVAGAPPGTKGSPHVLSYSHSQPVS